MPWALTNDRPIYMQIAEQIKLRVISGLYQPGIKLPSVRDLAEEAAVNPNTMQRALADLEREGLLHTDRTNGRFVVDDPALIAQAKRTIAAEAVRAFVERMKTIGYESDALGALIEEITRGDAK